MRISAGMTNYKEEVKGGYFIVTIEMCETLTSQLLKIDGTLKFGPIKVEIYAGGIDKALELYKEENKKDRDAEDKDENKEVEQEKNGKESTGMGVVPGDLLQDVDG